MAGIGLVISTLNDGLFKIEDLLKVICDEIIVVHQVSDAVDHQAYELFYQKHSAPTIHFMQMKGKGLSKSRNAGLAKSTAEYILICDDDGVMMPGFQTIVHDAILQNPTADILTFKTNTPDGRPYKKYSDQKYKHNRRSVARVTSREILVNRKWLQASALQFDERFGLGTDTPTGEEYILLCDALKRGANIVFIPEFIVTHPFESSGKNYNDQLIKAKGKVFARTYGIAGILVSWIFAVKKIHEYKKAVSFMRFIRLITIGSLQFIFK